MGTQRGTEDGRSRTRPCKDFCDEAFSPEITGSARRGVVFLQEVAEEAEGNMRDLTPDHGHNPLFQEETKETEIGKQIKTLCVLL